MGTADPAGEPGDETDRGQRARSRESWQRVRLGGPALVLLTTLAVLYAVAAAEPVLEPLVLAGLLQSVLRPLVRGIDRLRVPTPIGAAIVLAGVLGVGGALSYELSAPAGRWIQELPESTRRLRRRFAGVSETVQQVREATAEIEELTDMGGQPDPAPDKELVVQAPPKSALGGLLFASLTEMALCLAATLILTFFMLCSRGELLAALIRILPVRHSPGRTVAIAAQVQEQVSRYLLSISLINVCLAAAVAGALALLGMPNALLWGCMAGILNFVPYLGTAVGVGVVGMVSFHAFEADGRAILPPLAYLVLSSIEGGLVTPAIHGRRLVLSPIVVIVWLSLWSWMWGILGGLVAVPLLVVLKVVLLHVPEAEGVAALLGARRAGREAIRASPGRRERRSGTPAARSSAHLP